MIAGLESDADADAKTLRDNNSADLVASKGKLKGHSIP